MAYLGHLQALCSPSLEPVNRDDNYKVSHDFVSLAINVLENIFTIQTKFDMQPQHFDSK